MVDENINVKFRANASQLTKVIKQLKALQTKVKSMSKDMTKFNTTIKAINSRFSTTTKRTTALNKKFADQSRRVQGVRSAMDRLKKKTDEYNRASRKTGDVSKRTGSSIGLTGFQFGFLGGMASLASDRLRTFFEDIVSEGIDDLDAMNRAAVQSGISLQNFLGGDLSEFNAVTDRVKELQQSFGEFTRADVANAFEQIGRAVSKDVSVNDIEHITKALLTIARIDKTGGAGLSKTSIDLKRVMTQFGITASGLDVFLDKLVNTNQQGAIELNQLVSSLGFAGAQAQRFGVNIDETLALTGFIFEKSGRKAGAAGRTFGNILDKLASVATATNPKIKSLGINILDSKGNFNKFSDIIDEARKAFAKLKAEGKGQIFRSAVFEEFGFDKTAASGFLNLVNTSDKELRSLIAGIKTPGTAEALNKSIGQGAAIKLKTFENEIRNLKDDFASGLIPAIESFTKVVKSFTQDKEFVNVLKEFGKAVGDTLIVGLKLAVPVLKFFGDVLKNNTPIVRALAASVTILAGALSGLGITFLLLGAFFSLVRIHENLIARGRQLATTTNFIARQYVKLNDAVVKAGSSLANAFRGLSSKIIGGLSSGLNRIVPIFLAAGAKAGLFFGAAFNILANAFIGAGAWIKKLFISIGSKFLVAGSAIGTAFGTAWTAASSTVMSALGWLQGVFNKMLVKMGFQGGILGTTFGTAWTAMSSAVIRAAGWLTALWSKLAIRMGVGGVLGGTAFGAGWVTNSTIVMAAKGWWASLSTKLNFSSSLAGLSAGTIFGTAFISTLAIAIAGAADVIIENFTGFSFVRSITSAIFGGKGFSVRDILGLPLQGDPIFGSTKGKSASELFDIAPSGGSQGGSSFGVPNSPLKPGSQFGFSSESLKKMNDNLSNYGEELVNLSSTTSDLSDTQSVGKTNQDDSNVAVKKNTSIVELFTGTVNVLINEGIKNINIISEMTTMVAHVNLMWSRLIAEGNRAAGKLSSLSVSSEGNFSISDPGISGADQGLINSAKANLKSTAGNQVFLEPKVLIEINQTVSLENGDQNNLQNAADQLGNTLNETLRKQITSISS